MIFEWRKSSQLVTATGLAVVLMFVSPFASTSSEAAGADADNETEELSVFDQAARNLNSVHRYIDRVRETERERPRSPTGSAARYEWDQQSQWLQQQKHMAEEFGRELHSVIATDDPIGQEEELAVLNWQYEALKNQLKQNAKEVRTRDESVKNRYRSYKSALRQLK